MSTNAREFLARATASVDARVISLDELAARRAADTPTDRWSLDALRGRLVELSASGATATLTTAIELVAEAQLANEPACWLTREDTTFYPPDLADGGIDLSALVVVRVPDALGAVRVAERILRSNAFGLVVLDLGSLDDQMITLTHQGRLVTLAQSSDAAVVCMTEKQAEGSSIGSLVSLRVEALRHAGKGVELRALKDKRRGPDWTNRIAVTTPSGL